MRADDSGPCYDAAIVGGGVTGAVLAAALALDGRRVALIDAAAAPRTPPSDAALLRTSALTAASRQVLLALDVWPLLAASAAPLQPPYPYRRMRVWDAAERGDIVPGEICFDAAEVDAPALGWIVGNAALRDALWRRLRRLSGVTLYPDAALADDWRHDDEQIRLALADGRRLRARLLVGADGARSRVRERAAIPVRTRDYRQRGIVTLVGSERPHEDTAWQRFLPTGPIALLPLDARRCSVVWSMHSERVDALLALDDAAFGDALGTATARRLGRLTVCAGRAAFPLRALSAERYVGHRLALIGDAAHVVHPLAGQGVNLGILDAAALADAVAGGGDPGAPGALRRYQRQRRGANLLMLGALDALARLFATTLPPLRLLRNSGLNLVDRTPPLKRELARRAMGLAGDLPPLARPWRGGAAEEW